MIEGYWAEGIGAYTGYGLITRPRAGTVGDVNSSALFFVENYLRVRSPVYRKNMRNSR